MLASYEVYPIGQMIPQFGVGAGDSIAGLMQDYFAMAVLLGAPFLIVFTLIDMGLGLMNRFVPQLNIFFFSMPVKSALTFFLLIFYTTTLVWVIDREMFTQESILGFVQGLFP